MKSSLHINPIGTAQTGDSKLPYYSLHVSVYVHMHTHTYRDKTGSTGRFYEFSQHGWNIKRPTLP